MRLDPRFGRENGLLVDGKIFEETQWQVTEKGRD